MSDPESRARDAESLQALVDAAHEAGREGLVVATSGNLSLRTPTTGDILISAARSRLGRLAPEEIARLEPGGRQLAGPRPSRETPFHLAAYTARSDIGAVLHFQSPHATLLACAELELPDLAVIPEVPVYLGTPRQVAYHTPGSDALARAVGEALADPRARVLQLAQHGQIAVGQDPAQAIERAVFFELACRIWCLARRHGLELRAFSPSELALLASYGE